MLCSADVLGGLLSSRGREQGSRCGDGGGELGRVEEREAVVEMYCRINKN